MFKPAGEILRAFSFPQHRFQLFPAAAPHPPGSLAQSRSLCYYRLPQRSLCLPFRRQSISPRHRGVPFIFAARKPR
uniref:hypothetical protein n=1 Tax=Candidatus Electronema sp. TaxID=2698783 RepID=UPI004056C4D3